MTKTLRLFDRSFVVAGSDVDDYYRAFRNGADVTDTVLLGLRRHVTPDATCFDIGANIGLYSLALSTLAPEGRVYAFEPSPGTFDFLGRNLATNAVAHASAFQMALGEHADSTVHFHDIPFFTAGSFTVEDGSFLTSEVLGSTYLDAPSTTLDAFVAEHGVERVDVVKIDVEGGELAVLEGARSTLETFRPTVLTEFNSFAFAIHQQVLPQDALQTIRRLFPYVYALDRIDGSLAHLADDRACYAFLYDNGIHGPVDNLVCCFADLGVTKVYTQQAGGHGGRAGLGRQQLDGLRRAVSQRFPATVRVAKAGFDRLSDLRR